MAFNNNHATEILNNLNEYSTGGAHAKLCINMVVLPVRKVSRLSKEERTGTIPKCSRQTLPLINNGIAPMDIGQCRSPVN
ncbi:unnamed protein product [Clavelina lepadiformis]|uniref:Uncharacterized protein n=1 Tax=Clavelina lepadiformis TaxID=159417 RepID=A0ABP0GAC1_CLALP